MIKDADADGSGEIDFKEFIEIVYDNLTTDEEEKLLNNFEVYDPHRRGLINQQHLREMLKE